MRVFVGNGQNFGELPVIRDSSDFVFTALKGNTVVGVEFRDQGKKFEKDLSGYVVVTGDTFTIQSDDRWTTNAVCRLVYRDGQRSSWTL